MIRTLTNAERNCSHANHQSHLSNFLASLSSSYTSSCDGTSEGILSQHLCRWHAQERVPVLNPCEEGMPPRTFVVECYLPSPAPSMSAAYVLTGGLDQSSDRRSVHSVLFLAIERVHDSALARSPHIFVPVDSQLGTASVAPDSSRKSQWYHSFRSYIARGFVTECKNRHREPGDRKLGFQPVIFSSSREGVGSLPALFPSDSSLHRWHMHQPPRLPCAHSRRC